MKPPICTLCGYDFRHEWDGNEAGGGLVQFMDYRPLTGNKVGHPSGLGFFCSRHLSQARSLHHLSMQEALKLMREDTTLTSLR
ncbi:MAG TPA: hypothetical protein DEA96_00315 [Leptospiraceae bacterium]|nr:hypothetical protein [Spirochaetaceae bacterium]HBS03375.1 hypothetical protein [Leptospiraceae bacterium]